MWSHGDLNPDLLLANRRPPCTWVFITLEPRSPSAPVYPALDPVTGTAVARTARWRHEMACAPKVDTVSVSRPPASVWLSGSDPTQGRLTDGAASSEANG